MRRKFYSFTNFIKLSFKISQFWTYKNLDLATRCVPTDVAIAATIVKYFIVIVIVVVSFGFDTK